MIHITIERESLDEAIEMARQVYSELCETGRHIILDAPGDFRTSLPERRLSAADVLVTGRTQKPDAHAVIAKAMNTARDALGLLWTSFPEQDHNALTAQNALDVLESAIELHNKTTA